MKRYLLFHLFTLCLALHSISQTETSPYFELNSGTGSLLRTSYFTNDSSGFIGAFDGSLLTTNDYGTTWNSLDIGLSGSRIRDIEFIDEDTGFIAAFDGKVLRTTNGGSSWTLDTVIDNSYHWRDVFILTNSTVYLTGAKGDSGVLAKQTIGETSWDISLIDTFPINACHFINEDTGYLACDKGRLYITTNGGGNWSHEDFVGVKLLHSGAIAQPINLYSIDVSQLNKVYVTADFNYYIKSADLTSGWERKALFKNGVDFEKVMDVQFIGDSVGFMISQKGGGPMSIGDNQIFYTTNKGKKWHAGAEFSEKLWNIHMTDYQTGYIVGNNGTVYKTLSGWQNCETSRFYYGDTICTEEVISAWTDLDALAYRWELDNVIVSESKQVSVEVVNPGNHVLELTLIDLDTFWCSYFIDGSEVVPDSFYAKLPSLPLDFVTDTVVCDKLILSVDENYTISIWKDFITDDLLSSEDSIEITKTGNYQITVRDPAPSNCIQRRVFYAEIILPEFLEDTVVSCKSPVIGLADDLLNSNTDYQFTWSTGETENTIKAMESGQYIVSVDAEGQCEYNDTTWVTILDPETKIFTISDSAGCLNSLGIFDITTYNSQGYTDSIIWKFHDNGDVFAMFSDTAQYIYASSDSFMVELIVIDTSNSCFDTAQKTVVVNACNSLSLATDEAFQIYPNPSSGVFTINTHRLLKATDEIVVRDILGNIIHKQKFETSSNSNLVSIDTPEGIYFIELHSKNNTITKSLMIQ